jgi:two-component system CheB/CheR fusion protein
MARIALAAIAASPVRRHALAIALGLAAIGLRRALDLLWGNDLPLIFFFPAVMVSAWLGGAVAGAITTIICAVAATYFWIAPYHSFAILNTGGVVGLLVFIAVGALISVFNEMWRRGAATLVGSERIAQRLAAIVEWSDDAIMSKDLDSTIRSWNRGAERMFGYSAAEAIGQSMRLIIPRNRWAEEEEVLRRLRRGEAVDHFETIRCRRDSSEVPVSLTISPIVDSSGVVVGASTIARDISVRKQAEQTERDSARLKDEFLAIVSHELRTPVNAMLGWATLLQRPDVDEARRDRAARGVYTNARRQAQLIEELLDFSRAMAGKLRLANEPIILQEIIRDAIEMAETAAAAKQTAVRLEVDPALEPIVGDSLRLQQVVSNLLTNAIKFSPAGATVQVRVRQLHGSVELSVADNGPGIPHDQLSAIFEPFRQVEGTDSPVQGGLGLGLAIVKQIVEAHRGSISASSAGVGLGATFTVRLPAPKAEMRQHAS